MVGISHKTLILETGENGTQQLQAVMVSLQAGKDVLVAPTSPTNKKAKNNQLISEGAYMVCDRPSLEANLIDY